MSSRPMVSINISTYNRSHLLPRCLNSILSQDYQPMEIVIVDDASSDDTETVVQSYQTRDRTIRYIKNKANEGLAASRNTAIRCSEGHYIAFLDDDDEWIDDHKISKQIAIFEREDRGNLAFVCSGVHLVNDDGEVTEKRIQKPRNLSAQILKGNGLIYGQTVLTKKTVVERVGGFDLKLKRGIDSDFYRNCIVRFGYDVYVMDDITAAIHEYGTDRITPQESMEAILEATTTHAYFIRKYFKDYLINPASLYWRIRKMGAGIIKLIRLRKRHSGSREV